MKSIVIGAAILAAFTSLAGADEIMGKARESHAQMQPRKHHVTLVATDVVVDGRVVGRDPSEAVRSTIAAQSYSLGASGMEGGGGIGDAGGAAQ
jgi:hypothetical protein